MKKKRILHFHTSGIMAALFVLPLIDLECKQGYESRIITSIHRLKNVDGLVVPFDLNFKNLFSLPFAFLKIYRYLSTYKPDLIISHNFKSSLLPLLAARLIGVPSRVYFNHGVPYIGYTGILRKCLLWIEVMNVRLATEVITVSQDMKNLLLHINRHKRISLIANGSACGLDLSRYAKNKFNRLNFFSKHGVHSDNYIVTYVGRPEVRKGFLVALSLWDKFFQYKKSYKFFLCGPTKEDVIRFLGFVPENVYCLGFIEGIPEILFNTNYLILPSFHEGLSYAVLEAMASGCIVIANDVDGIRNLVDDGINGFLIKNNDIEKYSEKIIALENQSPSFLAKIKEQALKTSELYSREIFLEAYKTHISKILKC
jgi:glycosyltransferase involved in cell wall biosynthesis